ncbi:MAG: hypothetical protein HC914_12890 [Chloroflexaceae bacterium]|nr:hypothetical protein [Chloroflexaceae bacterium]
MLYYTPAYVQSWLDDVQQQHVVVSDDFNWHGLAQGATSHAYTALEQGQPDAALAWAHIAVRVYNRLVHQADTDARDHYECAAMMLRAHIIRALGAMPGHPLLDVASIEQWFLERLPVSSADVPNEQVRSIQQLKQLRVLKIVLQWW